MFLFLGEIFRGIDILILVAFAGKEFFSLIKRDSWWVKIPVFLLFFVLLLGFSTCIFYLLGIFLMFFTIVSLSELVAYGIQASIPQEKSLHMRSLAGVIGQIIVIAIVIGGAFVYLEGKTLI